MILGSRTATFFHEVLGHALVALIFGGSVNKIKISMFGGGRVWTDLIEPHTRVLFIFSMAGIIVNLITGVGAIMIAVKPKRLTLQSRLFLTVFAMISILGALAYLITGIYYEFGDPVAWTDNIPVWYGFLWLPLIGIIPLIVFFLTRHYASLQGHLLHTPGFVSRTVYSVFSLGLAVLTYAIFFIAAQQNLASTTASEAAFIREKELILQEKLDKLFAEIQRKNPELSVSEIQAIVDKMNIQVKREDVPKKFPILPVVIALSFLGGMAALIQKPEYIDISGIKLNNWRVAAYCVAASVVVLLLAYTGEYIYIK